MDESPADTRPLKRAKLSSAQVDGSVDDNTFGPVTDQTDLPVGSAAEIAVNLPSDDASKELEVGIVTFVDDARGQFQGILKKRYTDFLVNEILPNGHVVHLRSMEAKGVKPASNDNGVSSNEQAGQVQESVPPSAPEIEIKEEVPSNGTSASLEGVPESKGDAQLSKISDTDRAKLVEYFSEETVQQLTSLYDLILQDPEKKARDLPTVRTPFSADRSIRTQIHQDIRRIFHSKIDSSTDKDGVLVLRAAGATNNRNRGGAKPAGTGKARPGVLGWMDRGGEYLHFTLYKENKDTLEAISFITKQLRTTNKTFQFAGTKDRRAVTAQRVSAYRIEAPRLAGLNRVLRYSAVGDFEYQKKGLELGDLSGNEFVVTLRDCTIDGAADLTASEKLSTTHSYLSRSLQKLHENGFLNYYGLQRFGTFATRTDVVGVKILQGDFKAACDAILDFSPVALEAAQAPESTSLVGQDDKARAESINIWRTTRRVQDALDKMPRKFSAETAIIRHLGRQPQDFLGALLSIQRNLRLMYVHAYQSLVWNLAVGQRWRLFGNRVVEGDLVLVHEHKDKETQQEVVETIDADGEVVIQPSADDRAYDADDLYERARALSAEEAASGQYSIFDVVLPLPGYDVLYPPNASGQWYQTFMASEAGGGLDPHDMRRKQRDFSLSGGYRKILARIGADYDLQLHEYTDDNSQFVATDMERIKEQKRQHQQQKQEQGREPQSPPKPSLETGAEASTLAREEQEGKPDVDSSHNLIAAPAPAPVEPKKLAAVLKFQLGSSQYATMALRELSRGGIRAYKPEFMGGR